MRPEACFFRALGTVPRAAESLACVALSGAKGVAFVAAEGAAAVPVCSAAAAAISLGAAFGWAFAAIAKELACRVKLATKLCRLTGDFAASAVEKVS